MVIPSVLYWLIENFEILYKSLISVISKGLLGGIVPTQVTQEKKAAWFNKLV